MDFTFQFSFGPFSNTREMVLGKVYVRKEVDQKSDSLYSSLIFADISLCDLSLCFLICKAEETFSTV